MNLVPKIGEGIFELERQIGQGGAGSIWKAREIDQSRRTVAVKLVTYSESEYTRNKEQIEDLFSREARTWAEFQKSPHVVQLYRVFQQEVRSSEGTTHVFGFIMEYSPDGDLRRAIVEGRFELDPAVRMQFLLNLAYGLREGHMKDILHRDIKSNNVLLFKGMGNRIVPKLLDFGLSITTSTVDDHIVGTTEYMAPELFLDARNASKASDVYSLGVLFFEILQGRLPFIHAEKDKVKRIAAYKDSHTRAPIPDIDGSKEVVNLVKGMLAKDPRSRSTLNHVIGILEKIAAASAMDSIKAIPSEVQRRSAKYVWHPDVHKFLGEDLSYFFLRGTSPQGDTAWLTNAFTDKGIHGFSIYHVIGGRDYVVRVWAKEETQDTMYKILRDFRDFHNGSFWSFHVDNVRMVRGRTFDRLPRLQMENPAEMLAACLGGSPDDEQKILRRRNFIVDRLSSGDSKGHRFFITVSVASKSGEFLIGAYADAFAKALSMHPRVKSLSVYTGSGDFQILIKFRLKEFGAFSSVFDTFLTKKALIQRDESLITSQTFVELIWDVGNKKGTIESDDGSILTEIVPLLTGQ